MRTIFSIETRGPACHDFTREVAAWLRGIGAGDGVLTLMVRHTSAAC